MSKANDRVGFAAGTYPFPRAVGPTGATGATGPGGSPTGDPNAIAYFNPTGAAITDDPKLTAAPPDQFGRPQIRDIRQNGPTGAVYRQGAWMADGDATNVIGEGLVIYGAAPNGLQDPANGTFARVKPSRFAIRLIIGGFDVGFGYRTDLDTMPGGLANN